MGSFAETIAEVFDSEVNLTWNLRGLDEAVASFEIGTVGVDAIFERREPDGPCYVSFVVRRGDSGERTYFAFHIFNGVFQAVREFLSTRQPPVLIFVAKRDELAGIYQTYLERERGRLEELGYRLEGPNRIDSFTEFTLRRTVPSEWRS